MSTLILNCVGEKMRKINFTKAFVYVILVISLIIIIVSTSILFKNDEPDQNQTIISFITLGVTLFVLSISSYLSLQNYESTLNRDRDNLITSTINQNYTLFKTVYPKIEKITGDITASCDKEYLKISLLKIELTKKKFNDVDKRRFETFLNDHNYKLKQNSFQKTFNDYIVKGKVSNLDTIIFVYLKEYQQKKYEEVNNDTIKKSISQFGSDQKDIIKNMVTENIFSSIDDCFKNIDEDDVFKNKYDTVFLIVNSVFLNVYKETGHFFRHTHRILKMINDIPDRKTKKNFLGILRAQYSENIILAIYFNSVFTEKGLGLGLQLLNNDFFADSNDVSDNGMSIHANFDDIFFSANQKAVLKEHFIKNNRMKIRKKDKIVDTITLKDSFKKSFNC